MSDYLDEDGYPTDEAIRRISEWKQERPSDGHALFGFIRDIWWSSEWGFDAKERPDEYQRDRATMVYSLSTGGWSGNEDIIGALMSNRMAWLFWWESSRRGGHYTFRVPVIGDDK